MRERVRDGEFTLHGGGAHTRHGRGGKHDFAARLLRGEAQRVGGGAGGDVEDFLRQLGREQRDAGGEQKDNSAQRSEPRDEKRSGMVHGVVLGSASKTNSR